ncbi:MAG: heavy metal translocating P-type ATPase [Polyangiales bacterium]
MSCGCDSGGGPEGEPSGAGTADVAVPWWRIAAAIALAGQSMLVGLTVNLAEAEPNVRLFFHLALAAVTVLVLELVGAPLWRAVRAAIAERSLRFELLFAASVVGAIAVSVHGVIAPERGHVYFEVASILCVLFAVGHRLNTEGRRRSLESVRALRDPQELCEVRSCCGAVRTVPLAQVEPGQTVVVHPGRRIVVDGVVAESEALVREAAMTGEPFATPKRPGDRVQAGSHAVDGTLYVRATSGLGERGIDRIARSVERAWLRPARLQRLADRATRWLLPLVLAVAAGALVGWGLGVGWGVGALHAMAVLLVACPCAMGFATPLAVWSTTARLGRHGLVVRGGETVERLAAVDTVALDKTGTLTRAEARLADVVFGSDAPYDRPTMLEVIAAVERASDHPLAAPLRAAGHEDGRFVAHTVQVLPGRGVAAEVEDRTDGRRLDVRIGPEAPGDDDEEDGSGTVRALSARLRAPRGAHRIAIAVGGCPVGLAAVDEQTEDGAGEAIDAFRALGLDVVLLTGDAEPARSARFEGLEIRHGLSPDDKRVFVERLAARGRRVLFVGDGVNDGAAMAASHVALAPESGSMLAREVADGVWHGRNLRRLPWAVQLSRAAVRTIRSNLAWAAVYNGVAIAVAAAGLLHPVFAATVMVASSLLVTVRAAQTDGAAQDVQGTATATAAPSPRRSPTAPLGS